MNTREYTKALNTPRTYYNAKRTSENSVKLKVFAHIDSEPEYDYSIPAANILYSTYHHFKTLSALRRYIDKVPCMFIEEDITFGSDELETPARIIETHYISKDGKELTISDNMQALKAYTAYCTPADVRDNEHIF